MQRSAPLTPVQNASAVLRRKRPFGSDDGDGHEDLKKPKIENVGVDLKGTQRSSPQKACPGPRLVRSPVKRETRDVVPKWDRGLIDLTLSDDDE